MGVYQSDFIFQGSFPYVNPKFGILIMYYELFNSITTDIVFRVQCPGLESEEQTIEVNVPRKDIPTSAPGDLDLDEDQRAVWHTRIPFMFPIVIPKEGKVKVRAHYSDGLVLRLGSLRVRPATPEEISLLTGSPPPPRGG
jgi:hypothetical protein